MILRQLVKQRCLVLQRLVALNVLVHYCNTTRNRFGVGNTGHASVCNVSLRQRIINQITLGGNKDNNILDLESP